jgi:hypothetical protein
VALSRLSRAARVGGTTFRRERKLSIGAENARQKFNPRVKGRLPDPRGKPGSQGSNAYAGERLTLCWKEMDVQLEDLDWFAKEVMPAFRSAKIAAAAE